MGLSDRLRYTWKDGGGQVDPARENVDGFEQTLGASGPFPGLDTQRLPKSYPTAGIRSWPSYHLFLIPNCEPGF